MLQRMLGSGWGVLLPGLLIAGLMYADLSPDQWRIVILMGLVLTPAMLYSACRYAAFSQGLCRPHRR